MKRLLTVPHKGTSGAQTVQTRQTGSQLERQLDEATCPIWKKSLQAHEAGESCCAMRTGTVWMKKFPCAGDVLESVGLLIPGTVQERT
jgi:hypothetical protein